MAWRALRLVLLHLRALLGRDVGGLSIGVLACREVLRPLVDALAHDTVHHAPDDHVCDAIHGSCSALSFDPPRRIRGNVAIIGRRPCLVLFPAPRGPRRAARCRPRATPAPRHRRGGCPESPASRSSFRPGRSRAFSSPKWSRKPCVTTKVTGRPTVIRRRPNRTQPSSISWSTVPRLAETPRISSISARVTGW
jgi:hypothetical protein